MQKFITLLRTHKELIFVKSLLERSIRRCDNVVSKASTLPAISSTVLIIIISFVPFAYEKAKSMVFSEDLLILGLTLFIRYMILFVFLLKLIRPSYAYEVKNIYNDCQENAKTIDYERIGLVHCFVNNLLYEIETNSRAKRLQLCYKLFMYSLICFILAAFFVFA